MKNLCRRALAAAALVFCGCSFSTETAIRELLGASAEAPVFLGYRAVSDRELSFQFSLPVRVVTLAFDPPAKVESVEEGATVRVILAEPLGLGARVVADLLVEDQGENTLNVLIPFRARNGHIPRLLVNELRTEYSKPKVEFVELRAGNGGNLGALRLFIASNGIGEPVFEFPPAEVSEGEYIVLHLRTMEPDCVDETGKDLGLSKGTEALDTARDFWLPGTVKRIKKTDAVFLMDQDDRVIDAVFLSETPDAWWAKEEFAETAVFLSGQGAWLPPEGTAVPRPEDAVISKNTTATRTICRAEGTEDNNRAGDWYITDTSNASPGKANSPKRYTPK
jgi:hypothetical protein